MLDAVITDLLAIPDCRVITCVDERLLSASCRFKHWEQHQRLQVNRVKEPGEETRFFEQACRQADVVWIIAPEFDDILYARTEQAVESGACVVGSDLTTIKLCADKWQLYEFLKAQSLPTIPTSLFDCRQSMSPHSIPCVIKHRFGAGGLGLHYFTGLEGWYEKRAQIQEAGFDYILQSFIPGTMLSTVVLLNSQRREIFPVGEQTISWQSGFEYQGGLIPIDLHNSVFISIETLLQRVCDNLPGLSGYVGFDLLLPDVDPTAPLLVEINPRLTTSYTGYRQLTSHNLAERIVKSELEFPFIEWEKEQSVQFCADGTVLLNPLRN